MTVMDWCCMLKIALINEEKLRYKQEHPSKLTKGNIWHWYIFVVLFYFVLSRTVLFLDAYIILPLLVILIDILSLWIEITDYFTKKMKVMSLIPFIIIFILFLLSNQ